MINKIKTPASGATDKAGVDIPSQHVANDNNSNTPFPQAVRFCVSFGIGRSKPLLTVKGRDAWALLELFNAGETGCTPINNPAPRWSAYIFNLRKIGLSIETIHEPHRGAFPGSHARYVLRTPIEIISIDGGER